jgi:hypothetical protein
MPEAHVPSSPRSTARVAVLVAVAVILCGALLLFASFLLHKERAVVGTPGPRPEFTGTEFTVPAHQRACMSSITLAPEARIAQLELREPSGGAHGSPPIDVLLAGAGYRALAQLPAEQSEGRVEVPIRPPRNSLIGTVCIINRGTSAAVLAGSREPRSRQRSMLTIGGRPTSGDIALTFLESRQRSRLGRVDEVFTHASNLTDHLIPVWVIWILSVATLLGVPIGTVAAFYRALREDELATSP